MVYILGGWQSDFGRNWAREGIDIAAAFGEALHSGLEETGLEAKEIDTGHVGNFVGELFVGQGLLGGLFAAVEPKLDGLPTARHEAACASGSVAILAAMAEIEAGRYDLACVLGIEQMRNVPGQVAADHLAAAAWRGREFGDAEFVWPRAFSNLTEEYDERYGIDYIHLARIAEINFANGRRNALAQTRTWQFREDSFTEDDVANPVIEGRVRKNDCGQITDGAAVVFLASERRAKQYADKHGKDLKDIPRITGWGHTSSPLGYNQKVGASRNAEYVFPQVRKAALDARKRAGVESIEQIDAVEVHDCFAMTEYMAIDHLGITAPGEAWKAIEEGWIETGGTIPVNPSGGLIGLGHPVGATGIRMVHDAARQVTGAAADNQVEGARRMQTLNIGGSTTTTASFVVERAAA